MSSARRSLLSQLSLRYVGPEARCLLPVRRFLARHEARLAASGEHGRPGWVAPGRLAGGVSRPVCHALPYLRRMA